MVCIDFASKRKNIIFEYKNAYFNIQLIKYSVYCYDAHIRLNNKMAPTLVVNVLLNPPTIQHSVRANIDQQAFATQILQAYAAKYQRNNKHCTQVSDENIERLLIRVAYVYTTHTRLQNVNNKIMDVPKTDTEEADEEFDESDIEFDYSEADDITEDNSLEEETEHDEKCQKQQKIEITNLPTELWNEITSFLSLYNILQLTAVCKSIYNILQTSQTLRNRLSQIYGKKV